MATIMIWTSVMLIIYFVSVMYAFVELDKEPPIERNAFF